jgi:putative ATP-binding cassette transporter
MQISHKTAYENGRFTTLDLSQGQRKRLALLVALLEDRPILVLDEWAADQDPPFRQYFYETLLPQLKGQGKTIIAVTHDDKYFGLADRVVKMEYGAFVPYKPA